MTRMLDRMIERWNSFDVPAEQRLYEALLRLDRLHEERLILERRIHNQRRANRETWEIVEMRRKWLGTAASRQRTIFWREQYHKKRKELDELRKLLTTEQTAA